MSTSLYWKPIPKTANDLPLGLKWALQKRHGGFVKTKMDNSDIEYLKGLSDAEVKGAQELIEAIYKHGEIMVFEE